MARRIDLLWAAGLLCVVALIYGHRLNDSPPALHPDETAVIAQAQSIASTTRDREGRTLPLYFHLRDNAWMQPLPVYATALFAAVGAASGAAGRMPSVLLAIIDVALMYAVALQLFGRAGLALAAAGLLALAPLHFIHGRLALPGLYPVPFVLAWLYFLTRYVYRRQIWSLCTAAFCLGVGFYAAPISVLTMPLYFGLTALTLWSRQESMSHYAAALAGFAVPLVVLVPWFYLHHDVFRFTLGDWGLHTLANPRDGLRYSVFSWPVTANRISVYWGFFSPSYLFFTGGEDLVSSTRQAGVFLGVTAIPFLCGLYAVVTTRWTDRLWRVIVAAFVAAPMAAATFYDQKAAGRAVGMLPLGVLIAAAGFDWLLRDRERIRRFAVAAVLLLLPIQFYRFYDDYFARYPQRAAAVFGQGVARE